MSHKDKLLLIDKTNKEISIIHQAELLGISRSSIYYKPLLNLYDLALMRLIDEQYTRTPFYGCRKMTASLKRNGSHVNRKRVQRLMRLMGIEAIYPRPNLSKAHPDPYLLNDIDITYSNQVWETDITIS